MKPKQEPYQAGTVPQDGALNAPLDRTPRDPELTSGDVEESTVPW